MTAAQVRRTLERSLSVVPQVPDDPGVDLVERARQVIDAVQDMLIALGADEIDAEWRRDAVCKELAEQLILRQGQWLAALKRERNRNTERRIAFSRRSFGYGV